MGYVATKGGADAIAGAAEALDYLRSAQGEQAVPLDLDTITHQLRFLASRVLSEGGLYHPRLAALAIKQSLGDPLEASFALRAHRSTQPRLLTTPLHDTSRMRVIRRISSSFKDIPGGQILGPTTDYAWRLMRLALIDETPESFRAITRHWFAELPEDALPDSFPKVLDSLRAEGLLPPLADHDHDAPFDITREPLIFPVPRSACLATMARGETGSVLALAYSNMRGYGDVHPTIAELRVGYLPVTLPHPITGEPVEIGEILMTECEVVAMYEEPDDADHPSPGAEIGAGAGLGSRRIEGVPTFTSGYGACFGHNEVKAVAMAILDRALQKGMRDGPRNSSEDPEFVLLHIDGIDSMGFCGHYKMPHYVTFQSDMDRLRTTQKRSRDHGSDGVSEGES